MSKHEVIIRENTGTTKTEAPYLPLYVKKSDLAFAALCSQVAAEAGLTDTQVRAIFEGAFAEFEALEQESAVRIHVDGMTVCMVIYGSFPSADAAFDPAKNTLALAIHLDDDIKYALANVTPSIVTDDTATKVRITEVADGATPRPYGVIHGQQVFHVQGYNLVMSDTGAALYLEDPVTGTTYPCTVDEAVSRQLVKAHSNTLLTGGDYKLYLKSRGGDAEGPLQATFRKVKYLHVLPSLPTITKGYPVDDPTRIGICVLFKDFVLEGTNLADVTLKLKYSTDGTVIIESTLDLAKCTRTASKITVGQDAISGYLEIAHSAIKPVIVATNAAGSANYEFESAAS